ncbi:IucA/IucC family siderophore biosynthesis protein [Couchioplanes azureus]|uniref:IucA/IucC family siderophore biosynthesis protein n=1 Tax=Couchioplanes caeruleus TaxID=56438 RepID=UPI00166FA369|nr:IucA/IucC family siderophore biosynthesis protein [Couchioplanes caeruleus]GGQ60534.1 iron transporter [Couchioplanes caeruleus subsp. azureus]
MTPSVADPLVAGAADAGACLAVHAPHLREAFAAALPVAADVVGRRLRGALVREGLAAAAPGDEVHAFRRVEYAHAGAGDPADLLPAGLPGNAAGFAAELRNAVVNLAIALARQQPVTAGGDPDAQAVAAERLAVAGHNLHPCGRTRLGWDPADVLAHDLEAGRTRVGFLAVRDDAHLGDDLGSALRAAYPGLAAAPAGFRLQPVHAWQRDTVVPARHRALLAAGAVRILDDELDAVPTAALRTLLLPAAADGSRRYLKLSLDIQVTSTRRGISVASTRNGPGVSALLHRLAAADPDADRLLLMAETGGAAVPAAGRDMSAILRDGLTGRLHPGEQAVAGGALPVLAAGLVATFAATTGRRDDAGAAAGFLDAYARLLLPPLLRLTVRGVALEAHLQNCLPTFVAGVPHRLAVRDFAGLRLHPGRLAAAGHEVPLWPGSVVGTRDEGVLRAKIGYTALQAHLGELVLRLGESHGLAEDAAWRIVRRVVDETYDALGDAGRADHAAFTAPFVPHKALVRMRLAGAGDEYLLVENPLHAAA